MIVYFQAFCFFTSRALEELLHSKGQLEYHSKYCSTELWLHIGFIYLIQMRKSHLRFSATQGASGTFLAAFFTLLHTKIKPNSKKTIGKRFDYTSYTL